MYNISGGNFLHERYIRYDWLSSHNLLTQTTCSRLCPSVNDVANDSMRDPYSDDHTEC